MADCNNIRMPQNEVYEKHGKKIRITTTGGQ
jgi:hypothetical protein